MGLIFNGNNGTDTISATDGSLVIDGLDLGGVGNINAGIGTFSGNLNVGGVLTYEDVKNVDSVGIITARAGIIVGGSSDAGYPNYADNLTIHGTSNEGITIRSGTSHQGALYFSDATGSGTGTYEGFLIYDHNINDLTIGANHQERIRIASNGRVGINSTIPETQLDVYGGEIYYHSGSTGNLGIKLSYSNSNSTGIIDTYGNHPLEVRVNNSEKLRITSAGTVNIGGNFTQTTYNASITTGSVNKKISFGAAAHNDLSNEGSGIFFSRQNDGSAELSGLFSHSNGGFGIATREDMTFHTGGGSTYGAAVERLRITSDGVVSWRSGSTPLSGTSNNYSINIYRDSGSGYGYLDCITGSTSHTGWYMRAYHNGTYNKVIAHNTSDATWFETGGTERLRITSDGQLIHKANKASGYIAEFHQDHASNSGQILIDSPTNNDGRPAFIDLSRAGTLQWSIGQGYNHSGGAFHFATSSLGAGITGSKLTITSSGTVGINTTNTGGNGLGVAVDNNNTNTLATGSVAINLKNTNTTDNSWVSMDFNNSVGGIVGRFGAQFKDTSDKDTDLYFATRADGGSLAEAFRITSSGVINIGKGDEAGSAANLVEMYVGATDGTYGTIRGKYNRSNEYNRSEIRFGVESNASGLGFLAFATGNNSASEKLRITSGGDIRIPFIGNGTGLRQKIQFVTEANYFDEVAYIAMNRTAVSSAPSDMVFATGSVGSVDERLRITSDGQVQIGGDSAVTGSWSQTHWNLEVHDSTGDAYALLAGASGAALELRDTVTSEAFVLAANGQASLMSYKNGDPMVFYTTGSSTTTAKLSIDSAGKILIGNTFNSNSNGFKMSIKETADENAAIVFLDTDNMRGGYCGISKGTNQIMNGDGNVDFVVGSTYMNTHIISGNSGGGSVGSIKATFDRDGHFKNNNVKTFRWGGYILGSASVSVNLPYATQGNVYHVKAYFSHYNQSYGAYRVSDLWVYSGHSGIQQETVREYFDSGNGGTWSITRGSSTSDPIVVAKSAGTYNGYGHWWVEATAGWQ